MPPVLLLFSGLRRVLPAVGSRGLGALVAVAVAALLYTTPLGAYLIRSGVWQYGPERVLGALWGVPLEELAFFMLQPLFTGMVFYRFLARLLELEPDPVLERPARSVRRAGVLLALVWFVSGLAVLQRPEGTYLGLILVWALPVLAGLWWWRGDLIWRWKAATIPGVLLPTLWLSIADRIAIQNGVWRISDTHTLGWDPMGLPVEEAALFLITNMLVVAGLVASLAPERPLQGSDLVPQQAEQQPEHPS